MGPGDQLEAVYVVEVADHAGAEDPASSAVVGRPGLDVLRVRPHQIAERAFIMG